MPPRKLNSATSLRSTNHSLVHSLVSSGPSGHVSYGIPDDVDTQRFRPAKEMSCDDHGVFTVGCISRFQCQEESRLLVDAFEYLHYLHPHTRLLVIGDGPERQTMLEDVKRRKLANAVTLTGAIRRHEVPALLRKMDVAVHCGDVEVFAQKTLFKYMATGLAVVASDQAAAKTFIEHRTNGLIVNAANAQSLAEALVELRRQPAFAQRLGRAARDRVLSHRSWTETHDDVFGLVETCCKNESVTLWPAQYSLGAG